MVGKRRVKTDLGTRLELFGRPRDIVIGLLGEKIWFENDDRILEC